MDNIDLLNLENTDILKLVNRPIFHDCLYLETKNYIDKELRYLQMSGLMNNGTFILPGNCTWTFVMLNVFAGHVAAHD